MSRDLFGVSKAFIGVVHLLPLPGSPRWGGSMRAVIDRAEEEANILEQGGVNGIIVENFGDVPFRTGRLDPETISGMTVAVERVEEETVVIKISDTGMGIPVENLRHIFSPFFTTKEVGVGTGLGLYICHMIVEREGGRITVQSNVDRGTTFCLSLPSSDPT